MPKPYNLFKYNGVASRSQEVMPGDKVTIIAHRGASAYYPENTIPSFKAAIAMGADMVELDVQLTLDGEVVVFHDENISRCTNGRGRIADYTYTELQKLDAGSWFNSKFKSEKIPTLVKVLSLCKDRIAVNIEIKTETVKDEIPGGIEEKCLKIVNRIGMRKHVIFSSFDPRAIRHLKQIDRQAPVAVLFEKKHYGSQLPSDIVSSLSADAFNCSRRELSKKWLADLKHHGIPANVYVVNDEKSMKHLLALGVDGVFTDKPDILRSVLEDFQTQNGARPKA